MKSSQSINRFWAKHNPGKQRKGKVTLSALSRQMEIDQGGLSKILNGDVNIYLHRIVEMAILLNCKPGDLLPQEWLSISIPHADLTLVIEGVEDWLTQHQLTLDAAHKAALITEIVDLVHESPEARKKEIMHQHLLKVG